MPGPPLRDKTGNDFDQRVSFVPKAKKYELIALQGAVKEEDEDIKPIKRAKVGCAHVCVCVVVSVGGGRWAFPH